MTLTSTTTGSDGKGPNAGSVYFYEDNGIQLAKVAISNGTAVWSQKFLGGSHTLYATFGGNGNYSGSTSSTVGMTVTAALPIPTTGTAYLGAASGPPTEQAMEALETAIGRTIPLHIEYRRWPVVAIQEMDANGVWHPDANFQGDINNGRVPVFSWTCDSAIWDSDAAVASGAEDAAIIIPTAQALAQWPGPVLMRWAWEMNDFNPIDRPTCHGDTSGTWSGTDYTNFVAAWQHIWEVFQQQQATNVVFLWNPGGYDADTDVGFPGQFYPGNTFVDWLGVDKYQKKASSTWDSDFSLFYDDFQNINYGTPDYGHKPMIHGENASANYSVCNTELQHSYLGSLLADLVNYPKLYGYDYFDNSANSVVSWVLDNDNGNPANGGLQEYTNMGASTQFGAVLGRDFTITLSPASVTLSPGAHTTITVTVNPLNGYDNSVYLSASGLSHGMTASFNPQTVSPGSWSSTLTLTTTSATPGGASTVTITGGGGGSSRVSTPLAVTINAPSFTMTDSSWQATINPGQQTTATITITPVSGYTGTVKLAAFNLGTSGSGVTASFNPASVTGPSWTSTLTLQTTSSTVTTDYPIVITGTDSQNSFLTSSIFNGVEPSYILTVQSGSGGGGGGGFNCSQ